MKVMITEEELYQDYDMKILERKFKTKTNIYVHKPGDAILVILEITNGWQGVLIKKSSRLW